MGNRGGINTALPPPPPPATITTVHNVPDGPLELILLRLPSSLHLVRAAAACKRWRRVVADAGFFRRFRSLHPRPVVAGHYCVDGRKHGLRPRGCNPIFSLSASSADDTAGIRSERFSLDFLPAGCRNGWDLADSRNGVLLLTGCPTYSDSNSFYSLLVVCDPAARSCSRVIGYPSSLGNWSCFGAFLLDGDGDGDGGRITTSSFGIVLAAYDDGAAVTSLFTSADAADDVWDWRHWRRGGIPWSVPWGGAFYLAGHTEDAVYWSVAMGGDTGRSEVVVLDKRTNEFSRSLFPVQLPILQDPELRAVRCGDGAVRIAMLYRDDELRTFVRGYGQGVGDGWAQERRIPVWQLGIQMRSLKKILAVVEGSVVLGTAVGAAIASVDLSTTRLRRVGDGDKYSARWPAFKYQLPWPPTIRACPT